MGLLELYCDVDDFCQQIQAHYPKTLETKTGQRIRQPGLSESEIMTLVIHFHQSGYRHFKGYYCEHVLVHLREEFPQAVSYSCFVQLMPRITLLLWAYVQWRSGSCTGISFVDCTALRVCTNPRYYTSIL